MIRINTQCIIKLIMVGCKVLIRVIDVFFIGIRNEDLSDSQFEYTPDHNQFDTCIVTCVLNLIICYGSVKVLSTFNISVSVAE